MVQYSNGPMARQDAAQRLTIIGRSVQADRMRDFCLKASGVGLPVMLLGETGVGKDHVAEYIHQLGRADRPFVVVDCGVLPESLSETELFGHARGAFTDARMQKQGLLDAAADGTLFFNEVANMSLAMQARFLGILDGRPYRALGETREKRLRARVIAATNVDLKEAVAAGRMRNDLYHRLNAVTLEIPPLRERHVDVPELADHFLAGHDGATGFTPDAYRAMEGYSWPGNIRDLRNAVMRAAFLANGEPIDTDHLVPYFDGPSRSGALESFLAGLGREDFPNLADLKRDYLRALLRACGGNAFMATGIAGISRAGLYRLITKLGLGDGIREARQVRKQRR